MVSGNRFTALPEMLALLAGIECVVVSVEYRLAPETRAPLPAEDCYRGLCWTNSYCMELGASQYDIVVWGVSGGGGLAAAACMMARDSRDIHPPVKGLILVSPIIDDRCNSTSHQQFEYGSPWCGVTNRMARTHVLGTAQRINLGVHRYQAPGRACVEDMTNMPSKYIDAGECEVLRDPAVEYAMKMWRAGSTCELHIWPGAFHLFDGVDNPEVPLIQAAVGAKKIWLRRMLQVGPREPLHFAESEGLIRVRPRFGGDI